MDRSTRFGNMAAEAAITEKLQNEVVKEISFLEPIRNDLLCVKIYGEIDISNRSAGYGKYIVTVTGRDFKIPLKTFAHLDMCANYIEQEVQKMLDIDDWYTRFVPIVQLVKDACAN